MRDVQNQADARGIAIQRVGIKDAHLPFLIKTKEGGFQQVLARVRFTVALPSEYKGTHMSRFLEILMPWRQKPLAEQEMEQMLEEGFYHAGEGTLMLPGRGWARRPSPAWRPAGTGGREGAVAAWCFVVVRARA